MTPAEAPVPGGVSWAERAARVTPARLFTGAAGTSLTTAAALALRADHAAARDAVATTLDLGREPLAALVRGEGLLEVCSDAATPAEHLLRPDRGRVLGPQARGTLSREVEAGADLAVVVGDGLSVPAVEAQVPVLLPALVSRARARGWSVARPVAVRHCRVGIMNDIGEVLSPEVVVLLIGERPGLASAESLSAYMAYRPRPGHTDADRNLVSNIHDRGVPASAAATWVLEWVAALRAAGRSGVGVGGPDAPRSLGGAGRLGGASPVSGASPAPGPDAT